LLRLFAVCLAYDWDMASGRDACDNRVW
jgi:hypothetical protein